MYCRNCGKEIDEKAVICPHCGVPVFEKKEELATEDKGGFLWGILGCFVPIAGLILYLIWKDTKPKTAKAAGIGAIVFSLFLVAYFVFVFFIAFSLISLRPPYYY